MRALKRLRGRARAGLMLPLALAALCGPALAQSPEQIRLREQEMAQCPLAEVPTWGDGRDRPALASPLRLGYAHAGAPAWFTAEQVMQALQSAATSWSRCGVASEVKRLQASEELPTGAVFVHWSAAASRGNFGLADLGQRSLALNPAMFTLLRQRNPKHPAGETLQMVISHEMGHFFGLMAHSRRCIDVTSYYTDGKGGQCQAADPGLLKAFGEYRATLPTACDIERCRRANAAAPR